MPSTGVTVQPIPTEDGKRQPCKKSHFFVQNADRDHATVSRFIKHHGLSKHRRPRRHEQEPGFVPRERRLFEVAHVHGLWHCDFHDDQRKVPSACGDRVTATPLPCFISRLCCHAQC